MNCTRSGAIIEGVCVCVGGGGGGGGILWYINVRITDRRFIMRYILLMEGVGWLVLDADCN